MALFGGIENMYNAETWAESAWGKDGVNEQSKAMETLFGLFMCGFGAMGLVCAFVLDGTTQAKFAMVNAGVIMAFFAAMFVILPGTGYEMPGVGWLIPPFLFLGSLLASGYLHMNGADAAPDAA